MKKDLTEITTSSYLALSGNNAPEILKENLGGCEPSAQDFTRYRVPSGGGKQWQGEEDSVDTLEGIIIYHTARKAYWQTPFGQGSEGNKAPDCFSQDGIIGTGNPGGSCSQCPFNKFETAQSGKGKACKDMKLIFLLRESEILPVVLVLPPTSIKPFSRFAMRLSTKALPYWSVEVKIGLNVVKENFTYSVANFSIKNTIEPEKRDAIREYKKGLVGLLNTITVDKSDVTA